MSQLITLESVDKVYETDFSHLRVLNEVNLSIETGELVSIIGASGSGKSTLLNIIGLLDQPSSGLYCFDGRDMESAGDREATEIRNTRIGFIFQSFNLMSSLSVIENVELTLFYAGEPKGERRRKAKEALDRVGMIQRSSHRPSQLSGGEQQRAAIARAIVGSPLVILADEPTGNLDSKNGDMVMDILHDLHTEGTTVLLVTHDVELADTCERQIKLHDGCIVKDTRAVKEASCE